MTRISRKAETYEHRGNEYKLPAPRPGTTLTVADLGAHENEGRFFEIQDADDGEVCIVQLVQIGSNIFTVIGLDGNRWMSSTEEESAKRYLVLRELRIKATFTEA